MNYGKQIRRDIGIKLGALRQSRHILLKKVAKDTNIPLSVLDEIEIGIVRSWYIYHHLKNYYQCEIKIVEKE